MTGPGFSRWAYKRKAEVVSRGYQVYPSLVELLQLCVIP